MKSTRMQLAAGLLTICGLAGAAGEAAALTPVCPPMPSTVPQWWGYGYGPGHHAPMIFTPGAACVSNGPRRVKWPGGCGLSCPAPYAPIGCYGASGGAGCGCNGAVGYGAGSHGVEGYIAPGAGGAYGPAYVAPTPTPAPSAGPVGYMQPSFSQQMAAPAAAQRDDNLTWR